MKIFRIERTTSGTGMWYDEGGVYNPFIETLTEGRAKELPMGYDERYHEGGHDWYSGCESPESLREWFSERDIVELIAGGFRLVTYTAKHFIVEPTQVIFTKHEAELDEVLAIESIVDSK